MSNINNKKIINTKTVACNGEISNNNSFEKNINGHPLVYLKFKESDSQLQCPYCGYLFIYDKNSHE